MTAIFNLSNVILSFSRSKGNSNGIQGFINGKFKISKAGLKYRLNLYFCYMHRIVLLYVNSQQKPTQ